MQANKKAASCWAWSWTATHQGKKCTRLLPPRAIALVLTSMLRGKWDGSNNALCLLAGQTNQIVHDGGRCVPQKHYSCTCCIKSFPRGKSKTQENTGHECSLQRRRWLRSLCHLDVYHRYQSRSVLHPTGNTSLCRQAAKLWTREPVLANSRGLQAALVPCSRQAVPVARCCM